MDAALRLERVLALLQDAPPERILGAVRAVLRKGPAAEGDDALERVLRTWQARFVDAPRSFGAGTAPVARAPQPVAEPPAPRRWPLLVVLCSGLALGLWFAVAPDDPPPQPDAAVPDGDLPDADVEPPDVGDDRLEPAESFAFPRITAERRPPRGPTRWPDAVLAALALLGATAIWRFRGRFVGPRATPPPSDRRPALPPRPADVGLHLLDRDATYDLEWGVAHYLSDERTDQLDILATVDATAREAQPTLRFQRARRHREVWLWCDVSAVEAHPEIRRLSDDIVGALHAAGLPVERAWFWGTPYELTDDAGHALPVGLVADRRDVAHVAMLTDGRLASLWTQDATQHRRFEAELRELARWPDFALVDFADDAHGLRALAASHSIAVLAPPDLAGWLAGTRRGETVPRLDVVQRWAAACALSPDPVAESTAVALRDALALPAPTWALAALRARAPGVGGRLGFDPTAEAELLTWLAHSESGPDTTLARARVFWRDHFTAAARTAPADSMTQRWYRVAAHLVSLWSRDVGDVANAAEALYREQGVFEDRLKQVLGGWAPDGADDASAARLPWRWRDLDAHPEARLMLAELGLGGQAPRERLDRGHRVHLAAAACLVVAATAGVGWWRAQPVPDTAPHRFEEVGERPVDAVWRTETGIIGRRRATEAVDTPSGVTTTVDWTGQQRPCVEQRGATTLWRCGREADVRRGEGDWPARSRFVLQSAPDAPDARRLALALLDTGAADVVEFDPVDSGAPPDAGEAVVWVRHKEGSRSAPGVTVVTAADWAPLAAALKPGPARPAREVWPDAKIQGDALLAGGGCVAGQRKMHNGVEFVQICGGTFPMGSNDGEDDEKPAHDVTVSDFHMARSETTVAAYRGCVEAGRCKEPLVPTADSPDHLKCNDERGRLDHPINCVDWTDASAFCASIGARLPTEAEWEFAARGKAARKYPWGDEEPTCSLANFSGCNPDRTYTVCETARQAGNTPEGLCDLAGNVWEWVADCYDSDIYGRRGDTIVNDPLHSPAACERRVLRGGSFDGTAGFLRSASRGRSRPASRGASVGFRCVLGARPQQP